MPQYSTSIGAVEFATSDPSSSPAYNHILGYSPTSAPGGLFVQAPGLVLPMLWHRGSIYNYGVFGEGTVIPPLGSQDYSNGGTQPIWWDAPQSWGRENYLVRRPRTLIINVYTSFSDYQAVETWVNTNISSFQPLNLSIAVFFGYAPLYTAFVPLASAPVTSDTVNGQTYSWSMPLTDESTYAGGDCYFAQITNYILPDPTGGITNYYLNNAGQTEDPLSTPTGNTAYSTTIVDDPFNYYTYFLNTAKINQELEQMARGADQFNTFAMKLYQYDVNPTMVSTELEPATNPVIASTVADSMLSSGSPYISRQAFTNGDLSAILAQLLADVMAFFPVLP
jgi:hypothetical protein